MDEIIGGLVAIVGVVIFVVLFSIAMAFPIMWCWNYVIPHVFDLPLITWKHAWCLSFLSSMLIKPSDVNASVSK